MPLAWSEVAKKPEFLSLQPDEQEAARQEYFDSVVKPQVAPEELDTAKQEFDADTVSNVSAPPPKGYGAPPPAPSVDEVNKALDNQPSTGLDVAQSVAYRGLPEGLASATPLGMAANLVSLPADLMRWAGGKAYKAVAGEELPHYTENPIPNSHDLLAGAIKPFGGELYEPKTTAGQYANTAAQFASGGVAAGLPLATTIPAAVVSEGAGQMAKGTDWEVAARLAGALIGGAGANSLRDTLTKPAAPTAAAVKNAARESYQAAEKSGSGLTPQFTNNFIDTAKSKLLSSDELVNTMKSNKPLRDALDDLEIFRDKPMTLERAQAIDEQLGNMIDTHTELGRVNKTGQKLLNVQDEFRGMIDNADEALTTGGKAGFDALKDARAKWAQSARLRDVEKIIERANLTDNPASALKTGFKNLLTNDKRIRGFSTEERAAIKKAANTGIVTGVLRIAGSRLNPIIAGAGGGGFVGAGATMALSGAARAGATKLQMNRANNVIDTVASRGQAPRISTNKIQVQKIKERPLLAPFEPSPNRLKMTIRPNAK